MQDAIGYLYFLQREPGENREAFEARREQTVAANSASGNASILGALLALEDVNDACVVDNPTDDTVTINGISVKPHSLYITIVGGSPQDIGKAILSKKPPGIGMQGSVQVNVKDPNPVYGGNGPTYRFFYDTAKNTNLFVNVSIANALNVPSDALQQIQSAVIRAFRGEDGGPKARIASEIFASRFYCGIASLGPWARIVDLKIGTLLPADQTTVQLDMLQYPVIVPQNITLTLV